MIHLLPAPVPYLDHAATTPLRPDVLDAMLPFLRDGWGNASSLHARGRRARVAVDQARETVARVVGCEPGEVVFTSGGTEADNTALHLLRSPAMRAAGRVGLVTSAAEHEAVRRPAERLRADGHPVHVLAPSPTGAVDLDVLRAALTPETGLVSVMWVNNEVGTVSPVGDIAEAAHEAGAFVHTDAVQAPGVLPLADVGADLMTLSAHKVGGPPGVGALVVRGGVPLEPFIAGGAQERGRRGGTENVAGVVGFAEALRLAADEQPALAGRLASLRARLVGRLGEAFGDAVRVNTPLAPSASAPHILSVSFPPGAHGPLDGDLLLLGLDMESVQASAGSACASGALEPSPVLLAMGVPRATAGATVRLSLGRDTTGADVDEAVRALALVVGRMRNA